MKIVTPPHINDLDELLDVVLHPQKLANYLQQMADMRTAILESLDVYTTKDKADTYLNQATQKQSDALQALADANDTLQAVHEEVAVQRATLTHAQEEWQRSRTAQQDELTAREKTCQAQAAALDAQSQELTVREGALHAAQDAATKRKAQLDEEFDKMMKRKALLSEIN